MSQGLLILITSIFMFAQSLTVLWLIRDLCKVLNQVTALVRDLNTMKWQCQMEDIK